MFADFAQLANEREATDRRILDWAGGVTSEWLAGTLAYRSRVDGRTRELPRAVAAMHFFNHGTHHRGQLTTLMKQAGVDPGVTDLPWPAGRRPVRRLKEQELRGNKKAPGEESPGASALPVERGGGDRTTEETEIRRPATPLPMFGKICATSTGLAPNHLASVAPN